MAERAVVALEQVWPELVSSVCADATSDRAAGMLSLVVPQGFLGNTLVLSTASASVKQYVEQQLSTSLARHAADRLGAPISVAVSLDATLDVRHEPLQLDLTDHSGGAERVTAPVAPAQRREAPAVASPSVVQGRRSGLNPKYTFETFVRGSSNMLAHAAATAVAEQPAHSYNPLVIHGASGLGKTHLLHAIGWYTHQLYPDHVIRYVTSEEFTNEFINSIQHDKGRVFKERYRKVDLLLVDDIQFLSGKIQTQEEFFHTFNTLHQSEKQIVVTSDVAPSKIPDFANRLRTRFEWGLIADVQVPDLETRIAIVRKKAAVERVTLPPDVVEFIASRISTNIRELEGALTRITAFANLNQRTIDLAMTQDVLRDLISDSGRAEIHVGLIMSETAGYFGLSVEDLRGPSRARHLTSARQIAIYITRELTDLSLPKIGDAFGGRDHTTVMHAERKIRNLMTDDHSVYNQVNDLTTRIRAAARS
jgi:chromosomal replication initiator protein